MLICATQDGSIRDWCNNKSSGAAAWRNINLLGEGGNPGATVKLESYLKQVSSDENLCITAHGNAQEIGDKNLYGMESWCWDFEEFARSLSKYLPQDYHGSILMRVCIDDDGEFALNLSKSLKKSKKLKGIVVYGYNRNVLIGERYPNPEDLKYNRDLVAYSIDW